MNNIKNHQIKIIFVCLGNICRSPIAEAMFKKVITDKNQLSKFVLDSAGTSGYHDGELADPRTRAVAAKDGIEITHLSRKFLMNDFLKFDYILAMDKENLATLSRMANNEFDRNKVMLFRKFENQSKQLEVPDPYYGNIKSFEEVQTIVTNASIAFYEYLLTQNDFLRK